MDLNDPYAFPLKIRALNQSPSTFWRGGKDIFFQWCKDPAQNHIRDWLADKDSYVTQQGDPHLGNIGSYLTEGQFGSLAFGMVDFDDSHRGPFQLELLQGLITLHLAAREAQLTLTDSRLEELTAIVLDNYRSAVLSDKSATELLADDPLVKKLLAVVPKREYAKELKRYVSDDNFVRVVATRKEDVKDILRPADKQLTDTIAAALSQAIADDPSLRRPLSPSRRQIPPRFHRIHRHPHPPRLFRLTRPQQIFRPDGTAPRQRQGQRHPLSQAADPLRPRARRPDPPRPALPRPPRRRGLRESQSPQTLPQRLLHHQQPDLLDHHPRTLDPGARARRHQEPG